MAFSRFGLAVGALALLVVSCSNEPDEVATIKSSTTTSEATTTTVVETTTTAVATTAAPAAPPGLGQGSRGPEVQALEEKLAAMKYDVGKVDGVYDSNTFHAVMAFQKVQGLSRTGRATPSVLSAVQSAGAPGPMLAAGGANRVEVDIRRQILQLYKGGELYRVLSVSTGSGKRYCVDGQCATAVTPGGSFRVTRRISGWRTSRLGRLYNPLYFNGGIAIHGSPSVPAYPASHGCVRITMSAAGWFPSVVPNGTPVYVIGGPRAPVPFNEPAPGDTAPDSATTTTAPPATTATTAPPSTSTSTSTTAPQSTVPPPPPPPPPPD